MDHNEYHKLPPPPNNSPLLPQMWCSQQYLFMAMIYGGNKRCGFRLLYLKDRGYSMRLLTLEC